MNYVYMYIGWMHRRINRQFAHFLHGSEEERFLTGKLSETLRGLHSDVSTSLCLSSLLVVFVAK